MYRLKRWVRCFRGQWSYQQVFNKFSTGLSIGSNGCQSCPGKAHTLRTAKMQSVRRRSDTPPGGIRPPCRVRHLCIDVLSCGREVWKFGSVDVWLAWREGTADCADWGGLVAATARRTARLGGLSGWCGPCTAATTPPAPPQSVPAPPTAEAEWATYAHHPFQDVAFSRRNHTLAYSQAHRASEGNAEYSGH